MFLLWLKSGGTTQKRQETLDAIRSKGSLLIDNDLEARITTTNDCLGIIIRKDKMNTNMTATLSSWNCSNKTPLICSLDSSQFTGPQKLTKFPCVPQNRWSRVKRQYHGEDIFQEKEDKDSKIEISYIAEI